jgi:S-DNA-T family DNA segregation ATPase FtsK/SpoIIIE
VAAETAASLARPATDVTVRMTSVLLTAVVSGPDKPHWRDVIVRFRSDACVGDLRAVLAGQVPSQPDRESGPRGSGAADGMGAAAGLLVDGRYRDPAQRLILVLRHGALVTPRFAGAPAQDGRSPGRLAAGRPEVAVVGGLWSGMAETIGEGPVVVGRGSSVDLRIDDPDASRVHARFTATDGGVTVRDEGSVNGTKVGGVRVTSAELPDGEVVTLGGSTLTVRPVPSPDADTVADGPFIRFNRPPRTLDKQRWRTVVMPSPPAARRGRGAGMLIGATAVPLVITAVLYFTHLMHGPYLLVGLLSPVAGLISYAGQRGSARRDDRRDRAQYRADLARAEADLANTLHAEATLRRWEAPDAAMVLAAVTGPTLRLWERRLTDEDALRLRLGTAMRPARTAVRSAAPRAGEAGDAGRAGPPTVRAVPVTVSLPDARVLGIVGDDDAARRVVRNLVCQLAGLHAPHELRLAVLAPGRADAWDWVGWLPHAREQLDVPDGPVAVAVEPAAIARQLDRTVATAQATARRRADSALPSLADGAGGADPATPPIVLVVDGSRALRDDGRLRALLRDGPANGVFVIAVERQLAGLPEECQATLEVGEGGDATLSRTGAAAVELVADGVSASYAARLARALAPLLVASGGTRGGLPSRISFLTAHGRATLNADDVARGWAEDADRRPVAVLGASGEGSFSIDLRNGHDGPHLLVGGRTGMGKSEVLGTMITSLALRLPPSALAFLLIDLKEGSGLAPFEALPHTFGLVTNVGGGATNVERVLTSLDALRTSRQQELTANGGNPNYDEYVASRRGRPIEIPRLVVVVDEFAELRDRYPDALERLISMARLGRSAGIHLVLGTQLISRHVTGDIAGNANLRICLTVDDPSESQAVVGSRDPAVWSDRVPGRAAARSDMGYTVFQAGWLGAPLPVSDGPAALCSLAPFAPTVASAPRPAAPAVRAAADPASERDVVFTAINEAASALGERPDRGLHPPLPQQVLLAQITSLASRATAGPPDLVVGLEDVPGRLAQPPYRFCPHVEGHLLAQGGSRSGRTTLLRSVALAAASGYRTADLQLHVADFAGAGLRDLAALPNVGTIVELEDTDRVTRLLRLLVDDVRARQELLAGHGLADLAEARAREVTDLPYLLVLVDQYDLFWQRYWDYGDGELASQFDTLLRDGPAAGLWCVVTTSASMARTSSLGIRNRLLLATASREDAVAAGLRGDLPVPASPGRGYRLPEQQEVQLAIAAEIDQAAAVAGQAPALVARDAGLAPSARPPKVEPLPAAITAARVEALRAGPVPVGQAVVTLGVGGTVLGPVDLDLDRVGGFFVVSGPARSGRSTTLLTVLRSLVSRGGWSPIVLAARPGPIRDLANAGTEAAFPVLTRPEDVAGRLAGLLDEAAGRVLLLVDDAERFFDPAQPAALNALTSLAKDAYDRKIAIVAASTPERWVRSTRSWGEEIRQNHTGLLLSPRTPTDGDLFQLPMQKLLRGVPGVTGAAHEGRGLLVVRGRISPIQVAHP